MAEKKILSSEVEIGMFVARLDRPWRETSFLFQGFPVTSRAEIEKLKKSCRHVYILVPDEEIVLGGPSGTQRSESVPQPVDDQKHYVVKIPAHEELEAVRQSHDDVVNLLSEMNEILQLENELKLPMIEKSVSIMIESIDRNPDAYIWLTRIRKFDSYLYRDALSSSVWATTLGRALGLDTKILNVLATGVMVMDIGKTTLSSSLLNKTSRLTDDEWELMKTHVETGVRILEETGEVRNEVLGIVRTHHERWNGCGYPAGLKGNDIPMLGQIAGIVDFYVSVTTRRPYQEPVSPNNAIYMMYQQRGQHFSEILVDAFIQAISTYPTGSLVELSSGEVGVVISQNPGMRLRPNVVLLLDPDKQLYDSYEAVSLVDYTYGLQHRPVSIIKTLAEGEYDINIEEFTL